MIEGIVFDIDDTLYLERDYVLSGFADVARQVGTTPTEIAALDAWLRDAFEAGVRDDTFDRLRRSFPTIAVRFRTDELVALYRIHRPDITLDREVVTVLDRLRRGGRRLGALSDGPLMSQSAKVEALDLRRWLDPIVLTAAGAPDFVKPGRAGFAKIEAAWGLLADRLCYVADNPEKDFIGPRAMGWRTIRLRRAGQLRWMVEPRGPEYRPDAEIGDLSEVDGLLDRLAS